jgi:hypothetical protein
MRDSYDVIIIGGGAAGLMAAIEAGKRGRQILLIEHADKVGKKILISGGGRCNFTNLLAVPEMYLSENPYFAISALTRYTSADFIALVEQYGIAYHEKKQGQLFCDDSAEQIVDMLLAECAEASVDIETSCEVEGVAHVADRFRLVTTFGPASSESLIIATGGLSIPPMGATNFAHRLAPRYGLGVTETRPGLVPFTFSGPTLELCNNLSGVSVDTSVTCNGNTWRENILFTHRGLSGPAILQVSSHWHDGDEITIDLLPDLDDPNAYLIDQRTRRPMIELAIAVGDLIPRRLALALCGPDAMRPLSALSNKTIADLAFDLKQGVLSPRGTEGYRVAEVTVGGVDTADLSSQTMESKNTPGLYFIGEAVDVTGPLGGYNFQWAWSSGYVAGQVA